MEEKKLTDEKVNATVKSLKWICNQIPQDLGDSNEEKMLKCIRLYCEIGIAVINQQKAEIERLTEEIKTIKGMTVEQVVENDKLKKNIAEAVNSFVRLETLYKIKCKELEIANKKLEELKGGKVD